MVERTSILHPEFRYTSAARTDIRKLFNRVRKQLREEAEAKAKQKNGKRKAQ